MTSTDDIIGRITLGANYADLMGRCRAASVGGALEEAVENETTALLDYAVRMNHARRTVGQRRATREVAQSLFLADILATLASLEAGETVAIEPDDVLYNRRKATAQAIAMLVYEHEQRFGR